MAGWLATQKAEASQHPSGHGERMADRLTVSVRPSVVPFHEIKTKHSKDTGQVCNNVLL